MLTGSTKMFMSSEGGVVPIYRLSTCNEAPKKCYRDHQAVVSEVDESKMLNI